MFFCLLLAGTYFIRIKSKISEAVFGKEKINNIYY